MRGRSRTDRIAICLLLTASLLEVIAVLSHSPSGYDAVIHWNWIEDWHRSWAEGIYYPRWVADANGGFGSPAFYFYPPLCYVLSSALLTLIPSLSVDVTLRILLCALSLLSVWSFSAFLKSKGVAQAERLLASILYGFSPYRFCDVAVRTSLGEHAAFVILPLLLLCVDRLTERVSRRAQSLAFLGVALLWSVTLLTNIPTAAVFAMGLLVYLGVRWRELGIRSIVLVAGSFLLGTLATSFFLLPVLRLQQFVRLDQLWLLQKTGSPLTDLLIPNAVIAGAVYASLVLLGACYVLFAERQERHASGIRVWYWIVFFVTFFQVPYVTLYLFQHVPPFTVVQFSSRMDTLLCLAIPAMWAVSLSHRKEKMSWLVTGWSLALCGLVTANIFGTHLNAHKQAGVVELLEHTTKWTPLDSLEQRLETFEKAPSVWGTNGANEWIRPRRTLETDDAEIRLESPRSITLHRFYWPLWRAEIDGQPTPVLPDSMGFATLAVSGGKHHLHVWLAEDSSEILGWKISLVAILTTLVCASLLHYRSRRDGSLPSIMDAPSKISSSSAVHAEQRS